ncbi:FMN-binding negative transcriptional regulator [Nonomuraea sp. NPDC002799]
MYVPSWHREQDGSWMLELIRKNPLALLVINDSPAAGPFATHLPVIPDRRAIGDHADDLAGLTLLTRLDRANPRWAALETGSAILLSFTGPPAFVSPAVFAVTPATTPTWTFTSVQVRGVVERIDAPEEALGALRETARTLESGWDVYEPVDRFHRMLADVGPFRVKVTGARGMFKLSHENPADVRRRLRESFGLRGRAPQERVPAAH